MPPKTGSAHVRIQVSDVNDYAPRFEPPHLCGSVMEQTNGDPQTALTLKVGTFLASGTLPKISLYHFTIDMTNSSQYTQSG